MARSKRLHIVQKTYTVTQGNDPTNAVVYNQGLDLALELSKQLGTNVRQGHAFRVVGYGASLIPENAGDADTGIAAAVKLSYAPVTKHSVKAWNSVFKQWQKQKKLAARTGQSVRYDDFEVSFDRTGTNQSSRTSRVRAGGLGDDTEEYVAIYGAASSGVATTLEDHYNSRYPIPEASTDEFGVSTKAPKFDYYFPQKQSLVTGAHMSSIAQWTDLENDLGLESGEAVPESVHYMGGSFGSEMTMFPADNHIDVLAGVMSVNGWLLPPDVDTGDNPPQAENNWKLSVYVLVEGWTPLAN